MGKKHFCFFPTAETGNRTPNSGVKGSGANHYPRARPTHMQGDMKDIGYHTAFLCSIIQDGATHNIKRSHSYCDSSRLLTNQHHDQYDVISLQHVPGGFPVFLASQIVICAHIGGLTLSIPILPLSSSSTTSRELLSQFSTCSE